jgi:hypothetical protein
LLRRLLSLALRMDFLFFDLTFAITIIAYKSRSCYHRYPPVYYYINSFAIQ